MQTRFPPIPPRKASLPDGCEILIRQTRIQDREAFLDGFDRLSCQSIYDRFFEDKSELSDEDLLYFLEPDFDSHVSLVAESPRLDGELIASFRYIVEATNPKRAEFACIVDDQYQGRGVGRIMLQHLIDVARDRGVEELFGTALASNDRVSRLVQSVTDDFEISQHPTVREITIHLREDGLVEGATPEVNNRHGTAKRWKFLPSRART